MQYLFFVLIIPFDIDLTVYFFRICRTKDTNSKQYKSTKNKNKFCLSGRWAISFHAKGKFKKAILPPLFGENFKLN